MLTKNKGAKNAHVQTNVITKNLIGILLFIYFYVFNCAAKIAHFSTSRE
jgi:hypothetical protein